MKRLFVVCVDDATSEQQDVVTKYFKELASVGYWHWHSDIWLITDPNSQITAGGIRSSLKDLLDGVHAMIIQIDGENTWSAYGNKKSFEWLHKNWD